MCGSVSQLSMGLLCTIRRHVWNFSTNCNPRVRSDARSYRLHLPDGRSISGRMSCAPHQIPVAICSVIVDVSKTNRMLERRSQRMWVCVNTHSLYTFAISPQSKGNFNVNRHIGRSIGTGMSRRCSQLQQCPTTHTYLPSCFLPSTLPNAHMAGGMMRTDVSSGSAPPLLLSTTQEPQ